MQICLLLTGFIHVRMATALLAMCTVQLTITILAMYGPYPCSLATSAMYRPHTVSLLPLCTAQLKRLRIWRCAGHAPLLTARSVYSVAIVVSEWDIWAVLRARRCSYSWCVCIICSCMGKCSEHLKFCMLYTMHSGRGILRICVIPKFVLTAFISLRLYSIYTTAPAAVASQNASRWCVVSVVSTTETIHHGESHPW